MSTNPISLRLPQFDLETAEGRQAAHRYNVSGIVDLNQAIAAIKKQVDAAKTSVITTITTSGGGGGGIPGPPTTFPFPGLGAANDRTGTTTYTVTSMDNGILLIFNDASPIAVTLNSALATPYFVFATNLGSGLVTFTPTSGTINGSATATLPTNALALLVFNGVNWDISGIMTPSGINFADDETPTGAINSSNVTYTLAHTPNPAGSLELFLNGLVQQATVDFTLATATITFATAPTTGSTLLAWYRY